MANQIYFIDSKLDNYQTIIDSLASTDIYYLIDSSSDGLTQMSNVLLNYTNLDSIHVYSHGDVGSLNIGNSIYDNTNITNYKVELENIGKSLSTTGDILLYGCNVGQDEIGLNFINQIAQYTQADVAASDDLTGSKLLGGNWDLEVVSGVVETQTIEVKDYQGVMLDDHSNTTTDATALTLGTATSGKIESQYDFDYFKITLTAGQKYLFEINDLSSVNSGAAELTLYNSDSLKLGHAMESQNISYIATTTGTYYLEAREFDKYLIENYSVKATAIDDHSDLQSYATALNLGTVSNGNIETYGDIDYFKVDLVAGKKYLFEMNDLTLGANGTAYLDLYDSANSYYSTKSAYESNNKAQFSYTATTSGTYYLKASSGYSIDSIGTYTVKATVVADDHSDTTTNATALNLGTATNGNIELVGDVDYFKVDLVAGKKYLFEMNDLTLGANGTAYLNLYDSANSYYSIKSAYESNNKAQFSYVTTTSGTYYLKASESGNDSTGPYNVKASIITDDHSDLQSYATSLTLGTASNGKIEVVEDVDYFKVDLVAGKKYLFEMNDLTLGTNAYANLYLYDNANSYSAIISGYESNNKAQFSYVATKSGTYYLQANYHYTSIGTYTVKATVVADDHSDTTTNATALTIGTATNGNIEIVGDEDYFKVNLTAGQKYLFEMNDVTLGTNGTAYLNLYDSANSYYSIKNAYESNNKAQFSYVATKSGTYYLEASTDSSSIGKYAVKASIVSDDYSDTTTNAIALTLGTAKNGNIEVVGDEDYFKVNLTAGQKYLFEMNDLTLGTNGTAYLNLQDSKGYYLSYASEYSNKALFSYTATTSGTYYLKASESGNDATGTYTVKVTAINDDYGNTTATAKVLALETTVNGNIEAPADVDYFKVSLTAGKKYYFEMTDSTLGTNGYAYLNLYNSSSSYLNSGYESNGVTKFSYTATTTGTYYLQASSNYNSIGTYTVKVSTNATPELTGLRDWNSGENTLYLAQGTKINVNLQNYVYDENGDKVTITLNSSSLPSGLTFNNGIITGTTNSSVNGSLKITLKDSLGATNTQTITVKTVNPSLIYNENSSDVNHILGSTVTFKKPTLSNSTTFFNTYDAGEYDQITINKGVLTGNSYKIGNTTKLDTFGGKVTDNIGNDGILDTFVNPWATEQFTYGTAKAVTSINGVATPNLYKVNVVSTVITPGTVEKSDDWWDVDWYSYHNLNDAAITSLKTLQTILINSKSSVYMEGDKEVILLAGGNVVSYEKDGSLNKGSDEYYDNYVQTSTIIGKWTNSTTTGKDGYLKVTLNTGEVSAFKIDSTNTLVQTSLPAKGFKETMEWYYGVDLPTFSKYYNSILTSKSLTINEDTNKILKISDFNFENNGWFDRLKITQLETKGSLKLNGVDVALNQEISSYDISSGKLVYTPVKDAYGNSYSNFKYQIYYFNNYSTKTYTTTFDITNVADVRNSSSSYTLTAPDIVLNLTGTTAINGTGNSLNNTITGNSAANTLNGLAGNDTLNGGAGADVMVGGAGNDIYYVDNSLDKVYETTTTATTIDAGGIDTVNSYITSYSLTSYVENLNLTGTAINGTGNALNNTIIGNSVANTLNGVAGNDVLNGAAGNDTLYGGLGNDTLYGGLGLDKFVFNTDINSTTNKDIIKDFSVVDDTIVLENAIFTKLGTIGTLNTANFVSNTTGKAVDTNDYLVYNKGTGQLFYDADGSSTTIASIQIATLSTNLGLTNADFTVI